MQCAISGETPQVPVASRKSGTVFEKRLIESYISEHGTDPVTGETLSTEDLLELKQPRAVKPRPPAITSIPSLLSVLQNEWDAIALELYTLRTELARSRQDLATALYNNDAAVKVISRLTREKEEARDALSKITVQDRRNGTAASNGDVAMADASSQDLPEDIKQKIVRTQEQLSKGRRKRPVPPHWATAENIQDLKISEPVQVADAGSRSMDVAAETGLVLVGGRDGTSCTYSIESREILQKIQGDGHSITDLLIWDNNGVPTQIFATSAGEVMVLGDGGKAASFTVHAGPVTGLALHPSGEILVSVGTDKSIVVYDLASSRVLKQVTTSFDPQCCQFHPDGNLLGVGTASGTIGVFSTIDFNNVANLESSKSSVTSLSFSENGTWLATSHEGTTVVNIWDLRKNSVTKTVDFGSAVEDTMWDYSGQFLAAACRGSVAVMWHDKANKAWSEILKQSGNFALVRWGAKAQNLVVLTAEGALQVLQ